MSFLTPLYALGALAVLAPVVFHLIRRSPKGEQPFSSLMFLAPTPPRITRRSRIEHWLLLLLRAAALVLLALAFARPFLREAARLGFAEVPRRRVAVLVDTSASLRRGDLWPRAKALADAAIAECGPGDQLAVFAFDATARPLLGFEESATLDPARRLAVARAQLAGLSPTWAATNLGQALVDAVSAVEDVADSAEKAARMPRRVVLVSDLQQGSRLDALGDFEWPSDVELDLRTVSEDGSNAGLQWLDEEAGVTTPGAEPGRRVRVSNDAASRRESFELTWLDATGSPAGQPVEVYVPPGEGRAVRVADPPGNAPARSLRLRGDSDPFDNTLYLASGPKDEATVLYVGNDAADDPAGLLYYLQRVFPDTPRRTVRVVARRPTEPLAVADSKGSTPLVVLSVETAPGNVGWLRSYLGGGGTVLVVLNAPGPAGTLAALVEKPTVEVTEAAVGRDVMLGAIAFDHPLFAPFAGAQFNDFTKVHFWKYRRIDPAVLGDARVLARFENGDPAVVEKDVGKGKLVVLASGWQPADSQLARSSKFVPLMAGLLEGRDPRPFDGADHLVGDRVPLPAAVAGARGTVVLKPDGTAVTTPPESASFNETDQPGIYSVETSGGVRSFAVNLDPAESKTSPLHVETLEQFGCRLVSRAPKGGAEEHLRQMQNIELEGRQKLWRWLILTAVCVLIVETWLAGRLTRTAPARAEALAT